MGLDLRILHSSSLASEDGLPDYDDLGGRRSSSPVVSTSFSQPATLTGVTILSASPRNLLGGAVGSLALTATYGYVYGYGYSYDFSWRAPGSIIAGPAQEVPWVTSDSRAIISTPDGEDAGKYLQIRVRKSALPSTGEWAIRLRHRRNVLFDDLQPSEATSGLTDYRCVILQNLGDLDLTSLTAWIDARIDPTEVSSVSGYSVSGAITLNVDSALGFPSSGLLKNETRGEIMVYTSRTSTSFTVPAAGRAVLGSSVTGGQHEDVISCYTPISLATEDGYPASVAASREVGPSGLSWTRPTEGSPLALSIFEADQIGVLWIRRMIPEGFPEAGRLWWDIGIEAL